MTEIIYAHLNAEQKAAYIQWAMKNFETAIGNINGALSENGVAVVQFGHEGQLEKLWQLIRDILDKPEFAEYKSAMNFPLFYPTLQQIKDTFTSAGFKEDKLEITPFNHDLTEDTPEKITGFLRAFSEPALKNVMDEQTIESFYNEIQSTLANTDINDFRKEAWHRTLVTAKKS